MLELKLLGQFNLRLDNHPIDLPSRPAQSLLAYLALKPGTAYRRERLAGLLWPDATEANARSYLRQALWRIRKALGPGKRDYFITDDLTIAFDAEADYALDVTVLEQAASTDTPIDDLLHSVEIYHGELLPGFYDEWVMPERERLQAIYEHKLTFLLDRLVAEQRWPAVIEWAEQWITVGSVPERLYAWADGVRATIGDQRPPVEQRGVDRDYAAIRAQLPHPVIAAATTEGRAMTLDQAIAFAREAREQRTV